MLGDIAAAHLVRVKELHENRERWMTLTGLDICVTSAVDGEVTLRCAFDEAELRDLVARPPAQFAVGTQDVLLVPVFTSEHARLPAVETVAVAGARGCRWVPSVHCEGFRRSAERRGYAVSGDYDPLLVVPLQDGELREVTDLLVRVPFAPRDTGRLARSALRRPFSALNPVGFIDIDHPAWDLGPPAGGIELALPEEVRADAAVLTIPAPLDDRVRRDLATHRDVLRDTPAGESSPAPDPVLRGVMVVRTLETVATAVRRAASQVDAERRRLPRTVPHEVDTRMAQRKLVGVSRRLVGLVKEAERGIKKARRRGPAARVERSVLVDLVERAQAAYDEHETLKVVARLSPVSSDGRLIVPCPPRLSVRRLAIVYTTRLDALRQHRLGTSRSLLVMGAVMLLIAWRLQVMFPLSRDEPWPIEMVQTEALESSRDALVALLVVFPALLYTQLERIGSDRKLFDTTVGVALTTASFAFLAPVAIGILTVGDLRPTLVVASCAVVGLLALVLGGLVGVVLTERSLRRLRAFAARRRAAA